MKYQIRPMTIEDIDTVVSQEEEIFGTSLGYDMLYTELTLNEFGFYFILEIDDTVQGYIGMWIVENRAEIINFYVNKPYQGYGFGKMILEFILELCEKSGVEFLSLEVRKSNERAQNLYQSFGFQKAFTRPNYYSDGEDAYVMVKYFEVNG